MAMTETLRMTIAYEEPDEDGWIVARVVEVPGAHAANLTHPGPVNDALLRFLNDLPT